MGHKLFILDENQTKCCSQGRMNTHKLVAVQSQIWPTQEIVAKMSKYSCK